MDTLRQDKRLLVVLNLSAGRPLATATLLAECNLLDRHFADEAECSKRCRDLESRGFVEFRTDGFTKRDKWIITSRGQAALKELDG